MPLHLSPDTSVAVTMQDSFDRFSPALNTDLCLKTNGSDATGYRLVVVLCSNDFQDISMKFEFSLVCQADAHYNTTEKTCGERV